MNFYHYCSFIVLYSIISYSEACNEIVCASVVTKCMLMQSCACSINSCTCCPSCLRCLGDFYTECCECVNLCESDSALGNSTQVFHEERLNGSPALFEALTANPDPADNWFVVSFPVQISSILGDDTSFDESFLRWFGQDEERASKDTLNCSAIYLDDCTSQMKCKRICESMGAETSLWFQDGCCECAGCPKHSLYESRCMNCPLPDKKVMLDEYDDFGQGEEGDVYDEFEGDDYGEYDK